MELFAPIDKKQLLLNCRLIKDGKKPLTRQWTLLAARHPSVADIILEMTSINPKSRPSSKQLIDSYIFTEFRDSIIDHVLQKYSSCRIHETEHESEDWGSFSRCFIKAVFDVDWNEDNCFDEERIYYRWTNFLHEVNEKLIILKNESMDELFSHVIKLLKHSHHCVLQHDHIQCCGGKLNLV